MPQPFSGKLINGIESFRWLTESLPLLNGTASLCSAFLKIDALKRISAYIPNYASVRILVRWRAGDLLAGASDPECYELAKSKGWEFYVKQDFHGKLYSVEEHGILVGSWNATSSGFGLKPGSNDEIGTLVDLDPYNASVVKNYFQNATLVDDGIYSQIVHFLQGNANSIAKQEFPLSLQTLLEGSDNSPGLLLSECFHSSPFTFFSNADSAEISVMNDQKLLGVQPPVIRDESLALAFISTKIYRWTLKQITTNGGSISFGGLTAALHDALLEDPKPYRSDVKGLIQNLYSWIKYIGTSKLRLEVIQPRHSEILRML